MTSTSDMSSTFELDPNEDIIERAAEGEPPLWLWVQTCPIEDCPCRTALVVVASDRATLETQVEVVRDVWEDADDAESFARGLDTSDVAVKDVVVFELDIDSGDVTMPLSESDEISDQVAKVVPLVDGELLDRIASLWYIGKELEDSSTTPIKPSELKEYQPGQLLAWDEVYDGARMDVYRDDGEEEIEAEAIDTYCVRADCECNEVRIQFYEIGEEEDGFIGTVLVKVEEPVTVAFSVKDSHRTLLESFWSKYQKRHPNWVTRLAYRADKMQEFGKLLQRKPSSPPKKQWVSSSGKSNKKNK
jgi:hypothetical protein